MSTRKGGSNPRRFSATFNEAIGTADTACACSFAILVSLVTVVSGRAPALTIPDIAQRESEILSRGIFNKTSRPTHSRIARETIETVRLL